MLNKWPYNFIRKTYALAERWDGKELSEQSVQTLETVVSSLPDSNAKAVFEVYKEGKTRHQMADALGISYNKATDLLSKVSPLIRWCPTRDRVATAGIQGVAANPSDVRRLTAGTPIHSVIPQTGVCNALAREDILNMEELSRCSAERISGIANLGPAKVKIINDSLIAAGFSPLK